MTAIKRFETNRELPARLRSRKIVIVFFVFTILALGLAMTLHGYYFGHWHRGLARQLTAVLPLPAAEVNGKFVKLKEVIELTAALEAAIETEADPYSKALEIAIERECIRQLAQELSVTITQDQIEAFASDEENLKEDLTAFGWSQKDYQKYVVEPLLLSEQVEVAAKGDRRFQKVALGKIASIQDNIKLGVRFDDLAKQYSDDPSSVLGGYVGYWEPEDFPKGLESAADLEIDEVSDILETADYFAIIKHVDNVEDEESGENSFGIQMITINKDDLEVVLEQYKKEKEIKVFVQ